MILLLTGFIYCVQFVLVHSELPFLPCLPQRHSVNILQSPDFVFPRAYGYPVEVAFESSEQNFKIEILLKRERKIISRSALFIIDKAGNGSCSLDIHIPDYNSKEPINSTHRYWIEARLLTPLGSFIAADAKETHLFWGIKPLGLPPRSELHPNSLCILEFELDSLHLLTKKSVEETFSLSVALRGKNSGKLTETTIVVSASDAFASVHLKLPPSLDTYLHFTAVLERVENCEPLVLYTSLNDFVEEFRTSPDFVSQLAVAFRLVVLLSSVLLNYRL